MKQKCLRILKNIKIGLSITFSRIFNSMTPLTMTQIKFLFLALIPWYKDASDNYQKPLFFLVIKIASNKVNIELITYERPYCFMIDKPFSKIASTLLSHIA